MDYFRNYYGGGGQFGNWQQYAGMPTDRTFQGSSGAAPTGVPPPSSFSEMIDQNVEGFGKKVSGIAANVGNAASQLGQGNVMQAANAAMGRPPIPNAPKAPAAPTLQDYDYESMVGQ